MDRYQKEAVRRLTQECYDNLRDMQNELCSLGNMLTRLSDMHNRFTYELETVVDLLNKEPPPLATVKNARCITLETCNEP